MSADIYSSLGAFLTNWRHNTTYFEMLRLMASISHLFSESHTPYLDYRLTENLFCKYFEAHNDARSCTAYDARLARLGIGIELNATDMSFDKSEANIVLRPFKIAKECGCKFYFGSDAHHPQTFKNSVKLFRRAVKLLHLTEDDKFILS